jgi:hypothetical protein
VHSTATPPAAKLDDRARRPLSALVDTCTSPASPPASPTVQAGLAVRERDPDTSIAAAKRVSEHRSRLHGDILRLHQSRPAGLTDDEVAVVLYGDDRGTIARRRLDLVREGLLRDSGRRRVTRRGSSAIVWELV